MYEITISKAFAAAHAIRLPDGQPMSAAPDVLTARTASMAAEAASRPARERVI